MKRDVTHHAKQRITERTNFSLSEAKQNSKKAFRYGLKLHALTGDLYKYINSKQINGGHYSIRIYCDYIYVFDNEQHRLLTVYPVPEEYLPVSNYLSVSSSRCIIWIKTPEGKNLYVSENTNANGILTEDIALAIEFRTKQKALNYYKNNHILNVLEKQGYEFIVL